MQAEEALVAGADTENDVFSDTTMNISRGPSEESNGETTGDGDNGTPQEDRVPQEVTSAANANNGVNGSPDPTQPEQDESDNRRRTRVCKYYKTKSCKHGSIGTGCKFSHPKKCIKFLKHGEKAGGCKKKGDCQLYHPPLCWNSVNHGTCYRKKCAYHHLQGTKLTPREEPQADGPPDGGRREEPRDSRSERSRPRRDEPRPTYAQKTANTRPRPPPPAAEEDAEQQDFADLRWEMGQLREMVRKLLDRDRAGPPQAGSYSRHWGEKSWH